MPRSVQFSNISKKVNIIFCHFFLIREKIFYKILKFKMGVTLLVLKWQVYVQKAERKHWKNTIARTAYVTEIINHRTFTQIHTPTVVQEGGGVDGTPPRSFWYVAVFRNVFAFSKKPLIFLTRWGIFYGWWRCWRPVTSPTGSPSCLPSWILPRISALHEKRLLNKQFAWF